MNVKINHSEESIEKQFGVDLRAMCEKLARVTVEFALDDGMDTMGKMGELVAKKLTDEEILFLATKEILETAERNVGNVTEAIIQRATKLN